MAGVVVLIVTFLAALWWWKRRHPVEREDLVQPFPKNGRPEIWVKGQETGVPNNNPVVRVYEPVRAPAVSGKRPVNAPSVSAPNAPPAETEIVASGSDPSTSQTRLLPSHSQQPSISGSPQPNVSPPGSMQAVDVNQLVELIAQRIDPRTNVPQGDAPPRYPAFPY